MSDDIIRVNHYWRLVGRHPPGRDEYWVVQHRGLAPNSDLWSSWEAKPYPSALAALAQIQKIIEAHPALRCLTP